MSETISPDANDLHKEVALFRYGLIADLALEPEHTRGLYLRLAEKAAQEYTIPGTLRRRVAVETLRGWLRAYRRGGFDALVPRQRADLGSARALPPAVVDLLCQLKDDEPKLTLTALIKKARAEHPALVTDEVRLAESTVHRLLARRGLMKKRPDEPNAKDRRRFEHESAGDLWMSDVMHGPKVKDGTRLRKAYLIAFVDDATRLVPHAAFALSEGAVAYLAMLEQAVRKRGIPKRLYVDNGAAFRSKHLALVCAKLGIALIHARPYTPQGKGKMERWFRTVRMQFLPTLQDTERMTLDELNRALAGWVEGEYHYAPHRGLGGEAPAEKWARTSEGVRIAEANIQDLFLAEQRRRVQKDRTVTLDGIAFEVDAALVGERVLLRYDPSRRPDKRTVEVWHNQRRVEVARRVDVLGNCFVKRRNDTREIVMPATTANDLPEGLAMRNLVDDADDDEGLF